MIEQDRGKSSQAFPLSLSPSLFPSRGVFSRAFSREFLDPVVFRIREELANFQPDTVEFHFVTGCLPLSLSLFLSLPPSFCCFISLFARPPSTTRKKRTKNLTMEEGINNSRDTSVWRIKKIGLDPVFIPSLRPSFDELGIRLLFCQFHFDR